MDRTTGILLSISIISALGIAISQNPQVQSWLEEQRRKIVELLRQMGQELDPQSRRAAEAFALEGRTVFNDEGLAREHSGSLEATALATGRSLSSPSTIRRTPVQGSVDPNEAAERRRKGREYLARRNQQMYELQQRRKAKAKAEGGETPPTPTTFDEFVDSEGNLKAVGLTEKLHDPLPEAVQEDVRQVERHLESSITAAGSDGWRWGCRLANPFGDEYALDRSMTPKPPAPPKIPLERERTLERAPTPPIHVPETFVSTPVETHAEQPVDYSGLAYEEQLAIALSLSERESSNSPAAMRRGGGQNEDDELRAAIAASLMGTNGQQVQDAIAVDVPRTPQPSSVDPQPLVDLSPATPPNVAHSAGVSSNPQFMPSYGPIPLDAQSIGAASEASDELYRYTPELTRARLASHNAQQISPLVASTVSGSVLPFDPVRAAISTPSPPVPNAMDASFYSAHDVISPAARSVTQGDGGAMLVDYSEDAPQDGMRTPTSQAQSTFASQSDPDTDTWSSASARMAPKTPSGPRSEVSGIEVIDLVEDSDADVLSDESDGIMTPESWSEVGSRDADSDVERDLHQQPSRARLGF